MQLYTVKLYSCKTTWKSSRSTLKPNSWRGNKFISLSALLPKYSQRLDRIIFVSNMIYWKYDYKELKNSEFSFKTRWVTKDVTKSKWYFSLFISILTEKEENTKTCSATFSKCVPISVNCLILLLLLLF